MTNKRATRDDGTRGRCVSPTRLARLGRAVRHHLSLDRDRSHGGTEVCQGAERFESIQCVRCCLRPIGLHQPKSRRASTFFHQPAQHATLRTSSPGCGHCRYLSPSRHRDLGTQWCFCQRLRVSGEQASGRAAIPAVRRALPPAFLRIRNGIT